MALTPKRQAFVAQYLVDKNATQAAIRAGYSKRTADKIGHELLQNPEVAAAVEVGLTAQQVRTQLDGDRVLQELWRLARVDIGEAFDAEGRLKALKDIPEDVRRAISGVETDELFAGSGDGKTQIGLTRKLKFWEKTKALELLGKHFKLFTDKVELSGNVTYEQLVAGSVAKPEGGK